MLHSGIISGLYPIVDTAYVASVDMPKVAAAIIRGGAKVLQLRAKGLAAADTGAAAALRELTQRLGVTLIINDRVDIALSCGADGVHIGQGDASLAEARRMLGPSAIIGVSTHNIAEALQAAEGGADYISFGPIFPTRTKKDADAPKGIGALEDIRKVVDIPITAIGGITEANISGVLSTGADAAAMISEILLADDITGKVAAIMAAVARLS